MHMYIQLHKDSKCTKVDKCIVLNKLHILKYYEKPGSFFKSIISGKMVPQFPQKEFWTFAGDPAAPPKSPRKTQMFPNSRVHQYTSKQVLHICTAEIPVSVCWMLQKVVGAHCLQSFQCHPLYT